MDRLLASPRYGERMAWEWLNAARYADTDGYQSDPTRDMWPWRDWLVDALNRNVPYDRLTVEMLAGDLLPNATPEQILATGFHRNHPYNGEGGRIAEETRVENVFDRVETTATVWLGLTVGCARCHDHKYDPIGQEDYFGFYDFFNQTSESGAGGNGRAAPVLNFISGDDRARLGRIEEHVEALEQREVAPDAALDAGQLAWEAEVLELRRSDPNSLAPVTLGSWYRTGVLAPPDGDANLAFDHVYAPEDGVALNARSADGERLWRVEEGLEDGAVFELPGDKGTTYLTRSVSAASERSLVLSLGSDDSIRAWFDGVEVLANDVRRGVAPDQERVELALSPGEHQLLFKVVNTGGAAGFYFRVEEERAFGLELSLVAALEVQNSERTQEVSRGVTRAYRSLYAPWWIAGEAQILQLREELQQLRAAAPSVMVMDQLPLDRRRETHLLYRGSYDQERQVVAPHTPAFLPPLEGEAPRNRLTLARWLFAPEAPLTARVAVNRAWQTLFGRGLVATPEDFGRQGNRPSHPALLDWLARELVNSGWDLKAMHRRLVLSATYRQSATRAPEQYAADPDNVLLARSARLRLPSWMLRDQALALSGLLVEEIGGPPVRPYQPEGVWAEATFGLINYMPDEGDALYRRSLYIFWRRIVGPTVFFDSAKRQTCEVRSSRTNTPLHALVTLNETVYVEAARKFAERAYRSAANDAGRIAWAFLSATARPANPDELALLQSRFVDARAQFLKQPEETLQLLSVGASPFDSTIPPDELAAHAVICAVILNLDEVLTRP